MADLFDPEPAYDTRALSAPKSRMPAKWAGFERTQLLLVALAIALLAWGAWVTKSITTGPERQEFVQLQLQGIIGEYLQAQARSGNDEATASRETSAFMHKLDQTVAGLAERGKIVIVHEAIIGGDIPDVTGAVRQAVYAEVGRPSMLPASGVQGEMEAFLTANGSSSDGGR